MLYTVSVTGTKTFQKLQSGKFTSIVSHGLLVYTANFHANQVWVFTTNSDNGFKLIAVEQIVIPAGWTTLSVKRNTIVCCNRERNKFFTLPASGCSSVARHLPVPVLGTCTATSGEAYICDDDDDGTLLICDRQNQNLILMPAEYSWQLYDRLDVDTAPFVAALKDRTTNFLFVAQHSPDAITMHRGIIHPLGNGGDLDSLD